LRRRASRLRRSARPVPTANGPAVVDTKHKKRAASGLPAELSTKYVAPPGVALGTAHQVQRTCAKCWVFEEVPGVRFRVERRRYESLLLEVKRVLL
jgi:hypothetical protein